MKKKARPRTTKPVKVYSMNEVSDKLLGKKGTPERDAAEKWYEGEIAKGK